MSQFLKCRVYCDLKKTVDGITERFCNFPTLQFYCGLCFKFLVQNFCHKCINLGWVTRKSGSGEIAFVLSQM